MRFFNAVLLCASYGNRSVEEIGLITWLKGIFGSDPIPLSGADLGAYTDEYAAIVGDIYIREMAFLSRLI